MTRILVVDDTASHCQRVANLLMRHGFEVLMAKDADEGIEMASLTPLDLILMDVVMPGCNGFEATRRLRANPSTARIPVVFLSSKDQIVDRQWGLRQGAKAYLTKPVQETDLLQTLQRVLARLPQKTP